MLNKLTYLVLFLFCVPFVNADTTPAIELISKKNKISEGGSAFYQIIVPVIQNSTSVFTIKISLSGKLAKTVKLTDVILQNKDHTTEHKISFTPDANLSTFTFSVDPSQYPASLAAETSLLLTIKYSVNNNNTTDGTTSVTFTNIVQYQNAPSIKLGDHLLDISDNEESVVCAASNSLNKKSCYDIHLGSISLVNAEGSLTTNTFAMIFSRTNVTKYFDVEFESTYYKIPKLTDDTTSSEPFEGGTYKITERLLWKYTKQNSIWSGTMAVVSFGARTAPSTQRQKKLNPFIRFGLQREVEFDYARGVGGVAIAHDSFWKYAETDANTNVTRMVDNSSRYILYARLAINKSGSVMLTTFMDFNKYEDGPGEAGLTLTFGGKWDEFLSGFGKKN